MGFENPGGVITLTAGEALAERRRVKLDSSSNAVYADAQDNAIGVTTRPAASGERVSVQLLNIGGAVKVTALSSMSAGAKLYGADDGKVNDAENASGGVFFGYALEAATADGQMIGAVPTGPEVVRGSFTITATEAALNSGDGQYSIETDWGHAPSAVCVMVLDSADKRQNAGYIIDTTTTPGTVIVKGISGGLQLDAGDIVNWIICK